MKNVLIWLITVLTLALSGNAQAQSDIYANFYALETDFLNRVGPANMESFETIPIDSWIYKTRLPSPIPASNSGNPDYDLDGHFTITGNNIAYAPADELFRITDDGSTTDQVDGNQYLSFAPYYETLWPDEFDLDDPHPIITFDNFNDIGQWINFFGFYLYDYNPASNWLVMEWGIHTLSIGLPPDEPGTYFIGFTSNYLFSEVRLHTNQNGGSIKIDEIYYGYNPSIYSDSPSVPTVSEWGMIILFFLLVGSALGIMRRKTGQKSA